jgi:hypothetical protein
MAAGDHYRVRAAELSALAKGETNSAVRKEYESLALAYLRLAAQAERNSTTDIVYETPPKPAREGGSEPDRR